MLVIRGSQISTDGSSGAEHEMDPLGAAAAKAFAEQLAADLVPSIRTIPAQLHVGQLRAQRLRDYLAARVKTPGQDPPPNRTINLRDFVRGADFPPTL